MKKTFAIAFLLSVLTSVHGQDMAEEKCRGESDTKRSPCGYFMCLVDEGAYRSAYGLIAQGVVDACNEPQMKLARSKVLASNGVFADAGIILDELLMEFPDDKRFLAESARQLYLTLLAENPPAVEIIPFDRSGQTPQMIAWVENDAPVILVEYGGINSYFPRKDSEEAHYQFEETAMKLREQQGFSGVKAVQKQGYAHIGPGDFFQDSLLLFTAVDQKPFGKKQSPAHLGIYSIAPDASSLKRPKILSFCAADSDNAFPSFTNDGKTVIFSSTMNGGKGGMDLYQSVFENGAWSSPKPLEGSVNTPANESYPEVIGDTIFFASDREDLGYGGMDVYGYTLSNDSLWNLGYPINTIFNDFRIAFSSSQNAYMVSDRPGLRDGDKVLRIKYEDPLIYFKGAVAKAQWPAEAIGKKVTLTNLETGAQLTSTISADGMVNFSNVKGESNYELAVEGLNLPEGFELSLYDQDGKLLKEMRSNANGSFVFVLLTPYEYQLERYDNVDESILSVDILGRVDADEVPDEGFQIILLDSSGATIGNTYTSESGDFAFRSVSPSDTYIIKSEVLNANDVIHIVDEEGNVINTIMPDKNNQYVYVRLGASDRIITLTNELKQKVKISDREQFEIGSIYFDLNAAEIDEKAARSLSGLVTILTDNPHVNVELSGHTDSRGTAAYNEKLSQQRIEAVLRFLSTKGVEVDRVKGKGYGESRLKNNCSDGVSCSEEQHAENRRTEFRLYQSESNQ